MPEAAMYEDDGMMLWKDQVRAPVDVICVQPIPKAARMQCPTERQFGLRILSPYPCHHPGTGLLVDYIRHVRPGFHLGT